MNSDDLKRLQGKQLEILKEVDRVCKANGINYYLTWGSLLGAKRHGGFIPWDDDIDISMKLDDYIKFSEVAYKDLDEKYFFQSQKTDSHCFTTWNKVRINNTTLMDKHLTHMKCHYGICIDVFPLIGVPNSQFKRKIQKIQVLIYRALCMEEYLIYKSPEGNKKLKLIFGLIPEGVKKFMKKYLYKSITKYKLDEVDEWGEILSEAYDKSIFNKKIFGKGSKIIFEDLEVQAPELVEEYLTKCYGDYMKIPKVEDRQPHPDAILDFDKSYEEYQV